MNRPARFRRRSDDESGSAMIIAMVVMTITFVLSLTATAEAIHSVSATTLDRNQVEAVNAAEAGVDHALSLLQGASTLPCSATTPTLPVLNLPTTPVGANVSINLTYYDTFPPNGSPDTTCANGAQGGTPQAVEINSTAQIGNSTVGKGIMDALVELTPYLADAIYANTMTVNNNLTLNGQAGMGDNANIYIQGSGATTVTCPNNGAIYGSLYDSGGSISLSNNCLVYGDTEAYGNVTASNGTMVSGQITSTTGNISFGGTHAGGARVAPPNTVTPSCPSPAIFGSCAVVSPGPPVTPQNFPVLTWQPAAWTGLGYTIKDESGVSCAQAALDLQSFVPSTSTVFYAPGCQLTFLNSVTLQTAYDLVVWSGGLVANNSFNWQSSDGKVHNLYLLVPYTDPTNCVNGYDDITFKNSASFTNLNTLVYTPCNFNAKNSPISSGQLYVGNQLNIGASLNMTFQPETLPGVNQSVSYNAELSYLRQLTH